MEREQPKEKNTRNIHGMIVKSNTYSEEEIRAYLSMTVEQQQQKQLDDFIEVLNEELLVAEGQHGEIDEECYYGEYMRVGSAFFKPEISNLVHTLSNTAQVIQAIMAYSENNQFIEGISYEQFLDIKPCLINNVNALITLMELCKENPTATLSGEYPGGDIMKQEITT